MLSVVLATNNENKVKEIRPLLTSDKWQLLTLSDFPSFPPVEEDGQTLEENALKKARSVAKKTGHTALADDTGLEVSYLNGAPGVLSARYAGPGCDYEANNKKLLAALEGVPWEERIARFRCVVAIVSPSGEENFVEGTCDGTVAFKPEGKSGFGYDPVFWVPELEKTFAEVDLKTKNRVSHRSKAFRKARLFLEGWVRSCSPSAEIFKTGCSSAG